MPALESSLERYCKRKAKARGYLFLKIERRKGWPDRLMVLPGGEHWWLELKAKRGRLSKLQKYACRKLMKQGCNVLMIWEKEHFDDVLTKLDPLKIHAARGKVPARPAGRRPVA